jgi:protein-S-isoprenylcysteine O-methyltransferase Ste14
MPNSADKGCRPVLRRPGISVLVGTFLGPVTQVLLLFAIAGTFNVPRAWLYLVVGLTGIFGGTVLVARANPELVNLRGEWKKRKDIRPWDKRLLIVYALFGFYVPPAIMGLDVGRYHWSSLGPWSVVAGTALFCLGSVLITWAMLVNTHFEVTVRIQSDRGHRIISTGPYAIIRHPGYLGASLWALSTPLIIGSAFGLIPAAIAVAALVARTFLEDRVLQAELPTYAEYARRVRYRLLPGIW